MATPCAPRWSAVALGVVGMALTFTAPPHRVDLLMIGVGLAIAGVVWSPMVGPLLIGTSLPLFFFSRQLIGPLSVSPPGLAVVVSWIAVALRHRLLALRWPTTAFAAPIALFVIAALLSLAVTQYPLLSVRELRAVILEPLLFFWLLRTLPNSSFWALSSFLVAATLTAFAAIVQAPLGIGGTQAEGVLRVQAWYPSANHLALMLGRALPFLIGAALCWRRWISVGVAVVAVGLLLTFSTGGWVGAAAAVLVVVACLGYRRLAATGGGLAAALLVVVSGLAVVGVLPERLNPLRQTGGFRLDLWQSSLEMVKDHPLFGIGLDNFAYLYQQFYLRPGAAAEPNLSHPHNWVLDLWVSLGALGLIAFVWLLVRFWQQLRRSSSDPWRRWQVAGAAGAIADMLVHGLIDNSYFLVDLAFVFWLCLAAVEADD